MAAIIGFIFFILHGLFSLIIWALIISAILSWLVAFNVINTRNGAVWRIMEVLDRITAPILEPFRRIIPPVGGLDLSFLVAFLVIQGIKIYLLPAAETAMIQLVAM
ncbi:MULTISPECIES: YggT family protein [Asticcacaulis]|uniref:YggT family protein n=1 Tax=Asticcacaulis TaxID=76890 RepID=UPI001AE95DF0|nr:MULTISPECIES: YggT family protein [Asticcacaulis]MBP2157884.1 YggT family protein [Asticcacaulis solisilvae]MDR6798929.1 YggT family protein [Asticcacaulis sp. BE141]